jgi:CheY-like chemotaxis protein
VPRIMVADDNTNIQKMVVLAFEERGIEVITVGNGEAAVRKLPDTNPDLILADVFMPVRNGYEVCEFVKKDSRFAHIPVILLVGAFDPLDEKEARRVGADGVLKKPFVPPDPLIAMVTSALEKNPKIAAELAKAREVPAEPPPPVVPMPEILAKAEPKPLPEFPEPTPEEAAAIYGFGKGVRSLDDEEVAAGKEPKAPVAEPETEVAEDFDGSSTANDWRRKTGMDIEIPENVASEPSFSYGRDASAMTFPSERDVPPRRIHVPDEVIEQQSVTPDLATEFMTAQKPEPAAVDDFFHPAARPEPEPLATHSQIEEPVAASEAPAEFTAPPRTRSWMDMMAPPPAESSSTPWATEVPSSRSSSTSGQANASSAPAHVAEEADSPAQSISEHEPGVGSGDDERPKKKSWFVDAVEAVREAVHSVVQDSAHEAGHVDASDKIQEDIHEPAHEPAPEPLSSNATVPAARLIIAPADKGFSRKDPALEEPAAAHVTPEPLLVKDESADAGYSRKDPALEEPAAARVKAEPLLVNDEPSASSGYGTRSENTAPMHTFLPAPAKEQFVESVNASSNGESSFFEPAPQEPEAPEYSERIPTAPPPNREALAEIPFLMPPASSMDSGKVNQDTVDAVVARVLEKLEPQLHELLSKGVLKPLIENMLQGELAKKEK